ncbi:adenylate/guanylate cyclase domain-containing protein [Litoribacillus peritrichatus]
MHSTDNNNNSGLDHISKVDNIFSNADYYIRVIAYLAGAFAITVGLFNGHYEQSAWLMVTFTLVYPHLLHAALQATSIKKTSTIRGLALHIDCVFGGFWLFWMQFSLAPSILLLTMLCFALIVAGGIKLLITGTITMTTVTVALCMTFGVEMGESSPVIVSIAYSIGTLVFLSVAAYYIHMQANLLYNAKKEIENQQEQANELSHKMSKYLAPQVWQTIFSGKKDVTLETQRKKLVVFFSDIKGFTQLSEELEPEVLTELLNHYLTDMCDIALKHGGTIDKFIGDSLMIFFGDPTTEGTKMDAQKCVAMAIAMRKHMKVLQQKWRSQGIKSPLQIRMGINTGYCTVGNFGAEQRMDYTIVGKEVNLASRLESMAEAGEILLSYETFSLIKDTVMCRDKGEIRVKGFSRPLPIYQVVGFRKELGSESSYMEHQVDGFSMYIDEDKIQTTDKKRVLAALVSATARIKEQVEMDQNQPLMELIDDKADTSPVNVHPLNGKG